MFWKRRRPLVSAEPLPEKPLTALSPADALIKALQDFQASINDRLYGQPDVELEEARKLLEQALKIVRQSGVGAALAPTLLSHIKHWPSWSKRDDFHGSAYVPATDISAQEVKSVDGRGESTTVTEFTSLGHRWRITLNNNGRSYAPDSHGSFGSVDLNFNGNEVMSLDIHEETRHDITEWHFWRVKRLIVGDWMAALLEIASEASRRQQIAFSKRRDDEDLKDAKNIQL